MRVGNVEVKVVDDELQILVHECTNGYYLTFTQKVCGKYDALLRQQDVYRAMRRGQRKAQRDVLDSLGQRGLPGAKRGALRRALDDVLAAYSL